jgi:hypothetical protein
MTGELKGKGEANVSNTYDADILLCSERSRCSPKCCGGAIQVMAGREQPGNVLHSRAEGVGDGELAS